MFTRKSISENKMVFAETTFLFQDYKYLSANSLEERLEVTARRLKAHFRYILFISFVLSFICVLFYLFLNILICLFVFFPRSKLFKNENASKLFEFSKNLV